MTNKIPTTAAAAFAATATLLAPGAVFAAPLYGCPGFTRHLCEGSPVAETLMNIFQWFLLIVVAIGLAVTIAGFVMAILRRFTNLRPASMMTWRMYLTFFLFLIGVKTGYDLAPLGGYMFTGLFLLAIVVLIKVLWFFSNLKKKRG